MSWRHMTPSDLHSVLRISQQVHPSLPESEAVFAERLDLFPEGCLVLVQDDEVCGYAISHPIRHRQPPALDSLLGDIAPDADQYYIHDVAVLPSFRGRALARGCVEKLIAVAKGYGYPESCLVSVYGTKSFWARFGFVAGEKDEGMREKLRDYGDDATFMLRKN
ncbi:Acyl-CoA N-acyltransferase [Coniochaeta hoffmannii]|uniref:Acyl-CoA N-acyltransferase n=1 Tax=Coniochaeta hoffmannii TaxID=91930 RepID=A0AA38W0C6_9PEZI|nr:Acyl-CoA N-acyltransferase [Coniochaeta hoffmannii]